MLDGRLAIGANYPLLPDPRRPSLAHICSRCLHERDVICTVRFVVDIAHMYQQYNFEMLFGSILALCWIMKNKVNQMHRRPSFVVRLYGKPSETIVLRKNGRARCSANST